MITNFPEAIFRDATRYANRGEFVWTTASGSNTIAVIKIIVYIFSSFMQLRPQQRSLLIDTFNFCTSKCNLKLYDIGDRELLNLFN